MFQKPRKYSEIEKQILREICFYFFKIEQGNGARANSSVRSIGITDIHFIPKFKNNKWNIFEKSFPVAYLTLSRPGLFIGSKGKIIEEITNYIRETIDKKNFQFRLIENRINDCFIDFQNDFI